MVMPQSDVCEKKQHLPEQPLADSGLGKVLRTRREGALSAILAVLCPPPKWIGGPLWAAFCGLGKHNACFAEWAERARDVATAGAPDASRGRSERGYFTIPYYTILY